MSSQTTSTWTPERTTEFVRLWQEGVPTAEMARQLSNITPEAGSLTKNAVIGKRLRMGLDPRVELPPRPQARNVFAFQGAACMWPIGHPGEEDFHFCGSAPLSGKPYCATHAAIAYERPKAVWTA